MANQIIIGDNTLHIGDTIRVHYKLIEKEKVAGKAKKEVKEETRERTQVFEGILINIKGNGRNKTFTVRRLATGKIGVERIFPFISPWLKKVEVKEKGNVKRAKLYYLRGRIGREAEKLESGKKAKSRAASQRQLKHAAKK